jgi:hypothetical protein
VTIVYPSNMLPRPLSDGYGLAAMPSTIRTDMDNGFARVRRRFTRAPTAATLNWNMPAQKFGLFDSWWRSVLLDGTSWFLSPLRNGVSDDAWLVRGVQSPEVSTLTTDVYRISWRVEVEAVPALDAADVAELIASQSFDLSAAVNALHQFVHVDYPAASAAPIGP